MNVNPTGISFVSTSTTSYLWGAQITALASTYIKYVNVTSYTSATYAYIFDSSLAFIGSAPIVSGIADFSSSPVPIVAGQTYYVEIGSAGSSWVFDFDSGTSFPIICTDLTYVQGIYGNYGSFTPNVNILPSIISITTDGSISPTLAVSTYSVDTITVNSADLHGEITNVGAGSVDQEGFVWSTSSHGDPGNVAPVSSGYSGVFTDSGSFSAGTFDHVQTGLLGATLYYVRAYAHGADGYVYGAEISFTTLNPYRAGWTNLPGLDFKSGDTQTIYAEQLNDILARLHALDGG